MQTAVGPYVLKINRKPSSDEKSELFQKRGMELTAFHKAFTDRTKQARIACGLTQAEIATILGITQDTYKQYEMRTMLPHRYVPAFCAATRVTEKWLFGSGGRREAAE